MGYPEHCERCGSALITTSFGPNGFRVSCEQCGAVHELDDNLEPVKPSPSPTSAASVVALEG